MGKFDTGGAVAGAATGAKMGSALGPWGTAGGALIGGAIGGFGGGDDEEDALYRDPLEQQKIALANDLVAKSSIGVGGMEALEPYQKAVDTRYLSSPLWAEKMGQAEQLNPKIQYEQIGLQNQNVKDLSNLMTEGSTNWARELMGQRDEQLASSKGFGGSYNVAMNRALEGQLADRYRQNQLQALDTYNSLYGQNLSRQMSLMDYYTKQPTIGIGGYSAMIPGSLSTPAQPKPRAAEGQTFDFSQISSLASSLGSLGGGGGGMPNMDGTKLSGGFDMNAMSSGSMMV